jgi:hypothetical protein
LLDVKKKWFKYPHLKPVNFWKLNDWLLLPNPTINLKLSFLSKKKSNFAPDAIPDELHTDKKSVLFLICLIFIFMKN